MFSQLSQLLKMLGLIKHWQIGKPCDKWLAVKIYRILPPLKL